MLPSSRRLSRHELLQVKSTGKVYRGSAFTAYYLPNQFTFSRLAVTTSVKLDKRATVRNLLRRRLFSALKTTGPAYDILIFPSHRMLNLTYAQISSLVNSFLSEIHLV
jgi:ribonuclease P protein component